MSDLEMKVSGNLVREIVEAKIKTAIVSELGDTDELVAKAVDMLMRIKVNDEGKVSDYSSYNKYSLIEGLTRAAFRKAVREAVCEWVAAKEPEIEEAVARELEKRSGGIARLLVDGLEGALKKEWRLNIEASLSDIDPR